MNTTPEELLDMVNEIIINLEEWDTETFMIPLELAHQLKEELESAME